MRLESENEFIRGAVAGLISAAVICLFMEFFERIGVTKHCWLFMARQPVMQFKHTAILVAFSALIHLGVGAFWGVIIAFLYSKFFSERYFIPKGTAIGFAIFFLHLGLLDTAMKYPSDMRKDQLTIF